MTKVLKGRSGSLILLVCIALFIVIFAVAPREYVTVNGALEPAITGGYLVIASTAAVLAGMVLIASGDMMQQILGFLIIAGLGGNLLGWLPL